MAKKKKKKKKIGNEVFFLAKLMYHVLMLSILSS